MDLHFLLQVQTDLRCISEDIHAVERHKLELCRERERYLRRLRMYEVGSAAKLGSSLIDKYSRGNISNACNVQCQINSSGTEPNRADLKALVSSHGERLRDPASGSDSEYATPSGINVARKGRMRAQVLPLLFSNLCKLDVGLLLQAIYYYNFNSFLLHYSDTVQ